MYIANMLKSHNLGEQKFVINALSLLLGDSWGYAFFLLNININAFVGLLLVIFVTGLLVEKNC